MQRRACEIFYISFIRWLFDRLLCLSQLTEMFCVFLSLMLSCGEPPYSCQSRGWQWVPLFVYRQVNLFRCLTLHPAESLAHGTLSLYCALSAILPPAVVGKRQARYKPNKLLLSGGGRKTLRERIRKQRKKRKARENNRRDLHCQSPGGVCVVGGGGC